MPEFKLYCFAQSGNAFKAALMLNLCDARWEPRFVDFFGGETRLRWLLWDNHKLTSYIATLRYMVTLAKFGEPQVHDFLRGRVKTSLGILDQHLSSNPAGSIPTS